MSYLKRFREDVKQELRELAKLGVKVPAKAYAEADEIDADLAMRMSVSEAADMCLEEGLAQP